ncbi:MAG TPA: hypothetical protein VLU25_03240 [Acidobacteriota bacterium]|nr:hypothetical protein [Acidobacteriota bacterium]
MAANEVWLYRRVIWFLGAAVILTISFAFYLALSPAEKTPESLIALGSAAVGALAGLITPRGVEEE